jgi:hypothetical protein
MCSASKPKVERTAPPPMYIPEAQSEQTNAARNRERRRAAGAYGRESTILGGSPIGSVAPTTQQKTLLGT